MLDTAEHYLKAEFDQRLKNVPVFWDSLQQTVLDGIWVWDLENPECLWVNPAFWLLLGRQPETKTHSFSEWQSVVYPKDIGRVLEQIKVHCGDPNHPYDETIRFRHKDGTLLSLRSRGFAIHNEEGHPIRMVGTNCAAGRPHSSGREITEKEVLNEELRSISYAVSHDLKSPLNTTEMLLREVLDAEQRRGTQSNVHLVNLAFTTIRKMQVLIEDLQRYTTIVADVAAHDMIQIGSVVEQVSDEMKWVIEEAGATLEVQTLPEFWGDPVQIRILVQSLISNAIKYRRPGSNLQIKIWSEMEGDDKNALFFKDTGLGIRVADQAKIFDLFNRLHRAEEFPGSGVGLALCRRIVMNHGGSISVESEVGVGSTFKVIFPTKPTLVFTNLQKAERTGMLI